METPYLDEEDAGVTNSNAELLGEVMDAVVTAAVANQQDDEEVIYAAFVAMVEVLAGDEPDPVTLVDDPSLITAELVEAIEAGTFKGVRGLVNETTQGPVLLRAIITVLVQGIVWARDTELEPTTLQLSGWWEDAFEVEDERPEHLDAAVVYYLDVLGWVV